MSILKLTRRSVLGLMAGAGIAVAFGLPALAADAYTKDKPLKVALVLHGTLGDKSFFDSAAAGMKRAEADLPVTVKIIEEGDRKSVV